MSSPLLLRALAGEHLERPPIWLMRQAGRYLPEFREVFEAHGFWAMCRSAELAAQVTVQPIRRFDLDAAIIFSDILVVLDAMGAEVRFERNGPTVINPVRSRADIGRLREVDPDVDLGVVADAIRMTRAELPGDVPIIGFAGAPFTLLTYLMEGTGEASLARARALVYGDPEAAEALLEKLSRAVAAQLRAQVVAGASVVQLFDTWAETLTPELWRRFAARWSREVFESLADLGVPTIYFTRGTSELLRCLTEAGAAAYGVDWRSDLSAVRQALGDDIPVQGNLDPAALLTNEAVVRREAEKVLHAAGARGHVFNLGHGVPPGTAPEVVEALVKTVRGQL